MASSAFVWYFGRIQDDYDNYLADVKIDVSYYVTIDDGKTKTLNSTSTVSRNDGNWEMKLGQFRDPSFKGQIIIDSETFPITMTFSKIGLETRVLENPRTKINSVSEVNPELRSIINPKYGGSFDLQGFYKSGLWKIESIPPDKKRILDEQINNIVQFIINNPGNSTITISSSESNPTNKDNETDSPTSGQKLEDKVLATYRSNALKTYVTNAINASLSNNPNLVIPTINILDPIIGGPPWPDDINNKLALEEENKIILEENKILKEQEKQEQDLITNYAYLSRYTAAQWVKIDAQLSVPKTDCLANGYIIFDVFTNGHQCNGAVFEVHANGQNLLRDDGRPFASLNNAYFTTTSSLSIASNTYQRVYGIDIASFSLDIYDNALPASDYHTPQIPKMTTAQKNDTGRFKLFSKGDIMPMPTFPIPVAQKPTTKVRAGRRFNRFIITPSKFKELISSTGKELISFSIKCVGISNPDGEPYHDGAFDINCHGGAGSFIVYKLKNENNNLVVEYTSGVRDGATPPNREQDLPLFDFDPCANRIINENTDVFNNIPLEEVTPADLPD